MHFKPVISIGLVGPMTISALPLMVTNLVHPETDVEKAQAAVFGIGLGLAAMMYTFAIVFHYRPELIIRKHVKGVHARSNRAARPRVVSGSHRTTPVPRGLNELD